MLRNLFFCTFSIEKVFLTSKNAYLRRGNRKTYNMKTKIKSMLLVAVSLFFISDRLPVSAQSDNDGYELIFSDEFNLPNGSQPDSTKWNRHERYAGVWSRWISSSSDVVYIKNGALVCRGIPNRHESADTACMLTGAINTRGKFSFTYGKIEVRMKTNVLRGNFPAAWLQGLQVKKPEWYKEIDIVESFGTRRAYHTAYAHLTVKKHRTDGPKYGFWEPVDVNKWHVYTMEWTPSELRWLVDGRLVAEYRKSSDQELLVNGQWPYDYPMYIILNQSILNEGYNPKKTYETRFDWVRVYQQREE